MNRVVELISAGDLASALVRLWILAGRYEEGSSVLNRWERERLSDTHEAEVRAFKAQLEHEDLIDLGQAERVPLALITALDELRFATQTGKPRGVEPFEEEGSSYFLLPVEAEARHRELPLSEGNGNREAWFRWHAVVPTKTMSGIGVSLNVARGRTANHLARLANRGVLGVWIGHFEDQDGSADAVRLQGETSGAGRVRFRGVSNPERRLESIRRNWSDARRAGADGLVLPELTVTLEHRAEVRGWLERGEGTPLELVVAGSFHEEDTSCCYNTSELWDGMGRPLLRHRKLRPFGDADGAAEDIADGNALEILDTPIGIFALVICKDFLDDYHRVTTLFREVPVDWLFVPSYGDDKTSTLHRARARQLAHVGPGTTTIVATQRAVEVCEGNPLPGFAHSALEDKSFDVGPAGELVRLAFRANPGGNGRVLVFPSPRPGAGRSPSGSVNRP